MTEFTLVIEDSGASVASYTPKVPGCIATGATVEAATVTLRAGVIQIASYSSLLLPWFASPPHAPTDLDGPVELRASWNDDQWNR
jgi:hypothetical protein